MASTQRDKPQSSAGKCPICGAPTEHAFRPFCSSRCADVDLLRWLRNGYVIAGGKVDEDEDGDDQLARQNPGRTGDDDSSER